MTDNAYAVKGTETYDQENLSKAGWISGRY